MSGPIEMFVQGGYAMWPMLAIALAVLGLAARAGLELRKPDPSPRVREWIGDVLFWGGMALVLGLFATAVGITQAAAAIRMAGEVTAPLAWGGVAVALTTTIAGLAVLFVSGVVWFFLRVRLARLADDGALPSSA